MATPAQVLELRLAHIVDATEKIAELVARGRSRFDTDWVVRSAAKDQIETIGESVAAIQAGFDLDGDAMPPPLDGLDVPWSAVKRMRDRLTHRYYEIDWALVWETMVVEVPQLASELERSQDGL